MLDRLPDSFTYKSLIQKLRWVHHLSLQATAAAQYAEATCFFRFTYEGKHALYSDPLWKQLGEREYTGRDNRAL